MNKKQIKVIITGASGMVGEGVLLECLRNEKVSHVVMVNRRPFNIVHPKLQELVVMDFLKLEYQREWITGFDACFYCAGKSVAGMSEAQYTEMTFDTTIGFAAVLKLYNTAITFAFVSGSYTDSSEKGKVMWARIKGRTENALLKMFPGRSFNFRPSLMKPTKGQRNFNGYNRLLHVFAYPILRLFFPSSTIQEIGQAMINVTIRGFKSGILEAKDIKVMAD